MMTFEQLVGILKIPSLVKIDTEKKIITITTPIVTIGPISYSSAKSFVNDTDSISKFVKETFVERMVMWHDFKKEHVEWSRESIESIVEITKTYIDEISRNKNDKDKILLDYLRAFETECILIIRAIREAETDEREQRNSFLPLDDIFYAHQQLEFILKELREKTYPMIKSMTRLLPENSAVRKSAEQKLKDGADLLNIEIKEVTVHGFE